MIKIHVMKYFSLLLLIISCLIGTCQNPDQEFTIVFYNVENLFDTSNDPATEDDEFTPGSQLNWNEEKYLKKITDLSHVISSVNSAELPEIVGPSLTAINTLLLVEATFIITTNHL